MKMRFYSNLLVLVLLSLSYSSFAQVPAGTEEVEPNCYQKYAKLFESRGALDVEDGTYSDVIISIRRGSNADCYNGKVEVVKGAITNMYIKFSDGTFEKIERKYKNDPPVMHIVNGMSSTLITKDDESLYNVLFVKKIKPKKKEYQRAPEPASDSY